MLQRALASLLIVLGLSLPARAETLLFDYSYRLTTTELRPGERIVMPGWSDDGTTDRKWELLRVENVGSEGCDHEWATQVVTVNSMTSCAVLHGPCGCPDRWPREGRICRKCLQKEIWHRSCTFTPAVPEATEYDKLDKAIQDRKGKP